MKKEIGRREMVSGLAAAAVIAAFPPPLLAKQKKRHVPIGYTGITWRNSESAQAIADISSEGFYGFETFDSVLLAWEDKPGGIGAPLQEHKLPLISGYCGVNLIDPTRRKDEIAKTVKSAGIVKKYGGRVAVIGPNTVNRNTYDFAANKANIVATLNDVCQAVSDIGITAALHQHTGTCIESKDETYAVLDAVNTKYVRFGPDIGQLTKGGQDAVKVVKDYLPIVEHMHLKDWNGQSRDLAGYCPLGEGKVDVPAILDIMAKRKIKGMIMVELDNNRRNDLVPLQLVETSKQYLIKQGVVFRS